MTLWRRFGLLLVWLLPALALGWTAYRAPAWQEPRALTVALEPGWSVILGRETLRAPQADGEHVLLRREADGGWRLANIAPAKQVLWRPARGHDDRPTREWPLAAGAAFAVGGQSFAVLAADAHRLTLQAGDRRWDYDGLRLWRDGQPLPECIASSQAWLRERLAAWGLGGLMRRPLRLGGGVYCADRLGLPGVPVDTAIIAPTRPGFALRPGSAGRLDGPPVTVAVWNAGGRIVVAALHSAGAGRPPDRRPHPLSGDPNRTSAGTGGPDPRATLAGRFGSAGRRAGDTDALATDGLAAPDRTERSVLAAAVGFAAAVLGFRLAGAAATLAGRAGPAAHRAGAGTGRGLPRLAPEHPGRAGVVAVSAGLAGIAGLAVDGALAVERRPAGDANPAAGRRSGNPVATGRRALANPAGCATAAAARRWRARSAGPPGPGGRSGAGGNPTPG